MERSLQIDPFRDHSLVARRDSGVRRFEVVTMLALAVFPAVGTAQVDSQTDPQKVVSAAAKELRDSSFEARLRFRSQILGQNLNGVGGYVQLRGRPETYFRLDVKFEIGDQTHSIVQVCDGRYLWLHRDLPGGKILHRVDLRRIREAHASGSETTLTSPNEWLAAGGIPKLMESLSTSYQFHSLTESMLSKVDVWEVVGKRSQKPSPMPPEHPERAAIPPRLETSQLAPHVPDRIKLFLGRDHHIVLFPYRVEFQRTSPKTNLKSGQGRGVSTIMTLDFYEVRRRPDLDVRQFVFHPGDQEIQDQTDNYIKSMAPRHDAK